MPRRFASQSATVPPCHFEDSEGNCWTPPPRGLCAAPSDRPAALVQNADFAELCTRFPPYGFRPLCQGKGGGSALAMLRGLRDPARCFYRSCAVVGASGNLLGARLGAAIDSHDAVIRVNLAPDGPSASRRSTAPHHHEPTWISDIGERTTWRVLTMEGYGYLKHYPRLWLKPPLGHGRRDNMSRIPQDPLLAISCHQPGRTQGRCRADRLQQVFAHPEAASYLISPVLLFRTAERYFHGVQNQQTLSTGMTAIAFAREMCGTTHVYGFGNGSCGELCYHFYDCSSGNATPTQQKFYTTSEASGGFHNFSAQAAVLQRMAKDGEIVPHWGSCKRSLGDAPREYLGRIKASPAGGRGGRRAQSRHPRAQRLRPN